MVTIVDYGLGNIHSVRKAIEHFGIRTKICQSKKNLLSAKKVILPGVGAFGDAMRQLRRLNLETPLKKMAGEGVPILGICLGMQILFEYSEESPHIPGLGIMPGEVLRFDLPTRFKIPHMGWNSLSITSAECPLLKEIKEGAYVYFCHSYYPHPASRKIWAATCQYGIKFPAIVWQKNIFGIQFHPEKSQNAGLKIIENFLRL